MQVRAQSPGECPVHRHVDVARRSLRFRRRLWRREHRIWTPSHQHYVHRLDLATGSWEVKTAGLAGNIQATSSTAFVLKSMDQWVTFTYNAWGTGSGIAQLSTNTNMSFPGYYAVVYVGNFRYDARTDRLIHGNSGLSSQEIQAFESSTTNSSSKK